MYMFLNFLPRSAITARYVLITLPLIGEPGLTLHLHQERMLGDRGENYKNECGSDFILGQIDPTRR